VVGVACVVVRVVPVGMTLVGVVLLRAVGLVGMVLVRVILMLCWVAAGIACAHARSMPLIAITAKRRDRGRAARFRT
jgi:cyanate permease